MKSKSSVDPGVAKPGTTRRLRRCPRCRGPMSVEFEPRAGYVRDCLNCGHVEYLVVCPPELDSKSSDRLRPEGRHVITSVAYAPARKA